MRTCSASISLASSNGSESATVKLEIRYLIDGQQVDAETFERDEMIEASKHGTSECLSDLETPFTVSDDLKAALQKIRSLKPEGHKGMSVRRINPDLLANEPDEDK
jgi:hypothetical protein